MGKKENRKYQIVVGSANRVSSVSSRLQRRLRLQYKNFSLYVHYQCSVLYNLHKSFDCCLQGGIICQ